MKYVKLLEEKGIQLSDLPMTTQKKIDEINMLVDELNEIKSIPEYELEDEDKEEIAVIEKEIEELHKNIERKIQLFDPVKHAKKIEQIQGLADLKKQKAKGRPKKPAQVKKVPKVVPKVVSKVPKVVPDVPKVVPQVPEVPKEVPKVPQVPEVPQEATTDALDYLSKMIPVQQEVPEVPEQVSEVPQVPQEVPEVTEVPKQPYYEEEEDEDEEFSKYGDAKPKKVINKGWLLMGAGFFLLTWGAVNVFKERRG